MNRSLLLLSILLAAAPAAANYHCSFGFFGFPVADVNITFDPTTNLLDEYAEVIMSGKAHQELITVDTITTGEIFHAWLSKYTNNAIELIIFDKLNDKGEPTAKLINPNVPIGKESTGICTQAAN